MKQLEKCFISLRVRWEKTAVNFPKNNCRRRGIVRKLIEGLESRCLLSVAVTGQIPSQSLVNGESSQTIELSSFFHDPTITGTAVDLQTSMGSVPIVLTDSQTPRTVTNFLHYVTSGAYANTVFSATTPGFILQGGGFTTTGTQIPSLGNLNGEHAISNLTGTIAMALSNGPNSATSQWFVNLADNDGSGTTPDLDNSSAGGPYTAFGNVVYNGMTVINAIANLGEVDASAENAAWSTLPVDSSYTGPTDIPPDTIPTAVVNPIPAADFVTINPVVVPDGLNFTATSANPGVDIGRRTDIESSRRRGKNQRHRDGDRSGRNFRIVNLYGQRQRYNAGRDDRNQRTDVDDVSRWRRDTGHASSAGRRHRIRHVRGAEFLPGGRRHDGQSQRVGAGDLRH